jgi:uncharacterized membrane protein YeaQ/YmgE (transglycosylase-associated protein family)
VRARGGGGLIISETDMHFIGILVIGFLAGLIAKLLMPGRDPAGFIITIVIGIAGAFVATFLGRALGIYGPEEGAGFIAAVVGSIIVLLLYRMIGRPRG